MKLRVRSEALVMTLLVETVQLPALADRVVELPDCDLPQEYRGKAVVSIGPWDVTLGWTLAGSLVADLREKLRADGELDSVSAWAATDYHAWLQGVEIPPVKGLLGAIVER